jgi:hypothetical protein
MCVHRQENCLFYGGERCPQIRVISQNVVDYANFRTLLTRISGSLEFLVRGGMHLLDRSGTRS